MNSIIKQTELNVHPNRWKKKEIQSQMRKHVLHGMRCAVKLIRSKWVRQNISSECNAFSPRPTHLVLSSSLMYQLIKYLCAGLTLHFMSISMLFWHWMTSHFREIKFVLFSKWNKSQFITRSHRWKRKWGRRAKEKGKTMRRKQRCKCFSVVVAEI